jgi:hypothetical protein
LNAGGNSVDVSGVVSAAAGSGGAGDITIRVVEGNARITGTGENAGTEEQAEAGTIYASGGNRAAPRTAVLSPKPTARYINSGEGNLEVPFRWNKINFSGAVRLEIAGDRNFSRVVYAETAGGGGMSPMLSEGNYFWRVYPADAGYSAARGAAGKLSIVNAPAPARLGPSDNTVYSFRKKQPAVQFQWTEAPGASSYLLEAADNPQFTNPALSTTVRGTSLSSQNLGAGTWYWRITPQYAGYDGAPQAASQPAVFRIEQGGELSPPVLQNPPDRGMLNIAPDRGDIYFSWKGDTEAVSYTLRISPNRDLSKPVLERKLKDTFFAYKRNAAQIREGQYYWGVFLSDAEGVDSPVSVPRSFTALKGEITQRTIFPPDNYTIEDSKLPDIRFTWKTNLPYQTRIQIAGDADFTRMVLNEPAQGDSFQGRMIPAGSYYWRIFAEGSGRQFQSPAKHFTAASPLPAPVLTEPAPAKKLVYREGEEVSFRWNTVAGANYYQFKLYAGSERVKPVFERSLIRGGIQNINLNNHGEGAYYWTVQAFCEESSLGTRRTGYAAGENFTARRLRPVNLDYPGDGIELEGLRAYLEPGQVRWSQAEPVSQSSFILSRSPGLASPVLTIRNPGMSIPLPQLREGTYYWTIRAETSEGYDISARESRVIRVLPIPRLPKPANTIPPDRQIIGPAELRAGRQISFSWDPIPRAEGYFITLLREGGGTIFSAGPITENSYVLDDLSPMDVGNFIWRVEAVSAIRKREDTIEEILQRGEIGEYHFSIEFDKPAAPELKKPGVMYGL